jgi:hypothetical protein
MTSFESRNFRKNFGFRCRGWRPNPVIEYGTRDEAEQKPTASELAGSIHVLPTQQTIDHLADRIERAYLLRRPEWNRGCSTRRVWAAAAVRLWQTHMNDPALPLDSELFVASQPINGSFSDPWVELTQVEAGRRYRTKVRRIVHRLGRELKREVARAEQILSENVRSTFAWLAHNRHLSPLGCYIAAQRMGRADIADRFALLALEQHQACPLYQLASRSLLSADLYPAGDLRPSQEIAAIRTFKKSIVMN